MNYVELEYTINEDQTITYGTIRVHTNDEELDAEIMEIDNAVRDYAIANFTADYLNSLELQDHGYLVFKYGELYSCDGTTVTKLGAEIIQSGINNDWTTFE